MTIAEFNNKQEYARKAVADIDAASEKLRELMAALKKEKLPKEAMDSAYTAVNDAIIANNRSKGQLTDYMSLLDDIARRSKITWPPVCLPDD